MSKQPIEPSLVEIELMCKTLLHWVSPISNTLVGIISVVKVPLYYVVNYQYYLLISQFVGINFDILW